MIMRVLKVFNNNVALVDHDGNELVVIGKGVVFGRRMGDVVDPATVERRFSATPQTSASQLGQQLRDIPLEIVAVAASFVTEVRSQLGAGIDDHLIVPLADHIQFAIERQRDGINIRYPLANEIRHIYPRETAAAVSGLEIIRSRLGADLPALEAVPLALHLVNGQLNLPGMSEIVAMTEASDAIVNLVANAYDAEIDLASFEAARFLAHLRYLYLRAEASSPTTDDTAQMEISVRSADPKAYDVAGEISAFLHDSRGWVLTDSEVFYLAMHVHRLTQRIARPKT